MSPRGSAALSLALLLSAAPLLAQQGMTAPMKAAPGEIHGTGRRVAAGTIHVVGQTMGAQQIHFTETFKVEPSANLRAMLSGNMMVGSDAADLSAIQSAGDQLIAVPKNVDVSAYALLLIYDTKYKTVVASAILPNAKGAAYAGMKDSTASKAY